MQYVFQIVIWGVLVFLVLLRFDIARTRRLLRRSRKGCEGFLDTVDATFVRFGGDVSELGYRSRMLMDCAGNSAENVAAVHIILGSAQTAINSAEATELRLVENLRSSADRAIAVLHQLESAHSSAARRWGNLLRAPLTMAGEDIERAKGALMARFSEKYSVGYLGAN